MFSATILPAQDKIDRLTDQIAELAKQQGKLADKIDKIAEQQTETNKQIAVTNTEVKGLDKRMGIFFAIIIASSSVLFAGIFGLIGFVFWDRRAVSQPFEAKTAEVKS